MTELPDTIGVTPGGPRYAYTPSATRSMCQLAGSAGTAGVGIGGSAGAGGGAADGRAAPPHPTAAANTSAWNVIARSIMAHHFPSPCVCTTATLMRSVRRHG